MKEYSLNFTKILRYAPWILLELSTQISKFVLSFSELVVKECKTDMLIGEKDISRLIYSFLIYKEREYKRERERD